jgi:hypothetical protein
MKMASGRDWAFITAMIAGGSIAFPVLAPVALGSMLVLGATKLRELKRRALIAGIEMPALHRATGAHTVIGTARKFRATVASVLGEAQVLLEHAIVKDRAGDVLIRRSASTAFLLDRAHTASGGASRSGEAGPTDRASGGPMLVTGAMRLVAPGLFGRTPLREPIKRGDPRLRRMGVPADLAIAGELEASTLLEDDVEIAVTGIVEDEAIADLAFHREGGTVPVMRGTPGVPVLVEDLRLLAVGLAR